MRKVIAQIYEEEAMYETIPKQPANIVVKTYQH